MLVLLGTVCSDLPPSQPSVSGKAGWNQQAVPLAQNTQALPHLIRPLGTFIFISNCPSGIALRKIAPDCDHTNLTLQNLGSAPSLCFVRLESLSGRQ